MHGLDEVEYSICHSSLSLSLAGWLYKSFKEGSSGCIIPGFHDHFHNLAFIQHGEVSDGEEEVQMFGHVGGDLEGYCVQGPDCPAQEDMSFELHEVMD